MINKNLRNHKLSKTSLSHISSLNFLFNIFQIIINLITIWNFNNSKEYKRKFKKLRINNFNFNFFIRTLLAILNYYDAF